MIFRFSFVGLVVEKIIFFQRNVDDIFKSGGRKLFFSGGCFFLEDINLFPKNHEKQTFKHELSVNTFVTLGFEK